MRTTAMWRRLALLSTGLLAGALATGPGAQPAQAHGESTPLIQTVVDGVSPPIPGVSVENGRGLPNQLTIVNRTTTELQVLGMSGRPFLRISAGGVYANVADLAWYRSGNPDSVYVPPANFRVGAAAHWVRISSQPAWSFFDFRLRPSRTVVPPNARDGRQPVRLDNWSVPLRYGDRSAAAHGHVDFVPIVGEPVPVLSSPVQLAPGVMVALLPGRRPGLALANSGRRAVTVVGASGEPFARIGPRGVEVNLHSPTYAEMLLIQGTRPPAAVDPRASPQWRHVSDQPAYQWVDSRLYYAPGQPSEDIVRAARRKLLMRWLVPIRDGNRTLEVRGATTWVPLASTSERPPAGASGPATWLGVMAILLVLAVVVALRRRQVDTAQPAGVDSLA